MRIYVRASEVQLKWVECAPSSIHQVFIISISPNFMKGEKHTVFCLSWMWNHLLMSQFFRSLSVIISIGSLQMYNLLIDAHALVHFFFFSHLFIGFTEFYYSRKFGFFSHQSAPVSLGIYIEFKSLFSTTINHYITFKKMSNFLFTIWPYNIIRIFHVYLLNPCLLVVSEEATPLFLKLFNWFNKY